MDKVREEFEAWKAYPLPPLNADGQYPNEYLQREWAAWQASRAALALVIPKAPSKKLVGGDFLCGWLALSEQVADELEEAGIRTK